MTATRPRRQRRRRERADEKDPIVDTTLVRWMRRLTPRERLRVLEDYVRFVSEGRGRAAR